jgi:ATPase subunit of ABC transporter with duplicated ATPase domains
MREIGAASQRGTRLEAWPDAANSPEPLSSVRKRVAEASAAMRGALDELKHALDEVNKLRDADMVIDVRLSDEARALRKQVETVQAGAGDASRRVAQLRERVGQLSALQALEKQRRAEITELQALRTKVLDGLDELRDARFIARRQVVERLRAELAPRIDLKLTQGAQVAAYASAITSSLRGSGLHYKNLAPRLAERMTPRELVQAIERGDVGLIASLGEVSTERAARLIDHIKTTGPEEILTAPIDDAVDLFLLDGKEYKPTAQLSTGQRCTVVLPILLAHDEKVLVVDEPEAHLDNAFIVGTVLQALRSRGSAQTICATHNANIPVLGNANQVIALQSDGVHGFVDCAAPLDSPDVVDAISSVMEGGREAFELRAKFYNSNP